VAVTLDGKQAILSCKGLFSGGYLKVWDLERGEELRTLSGHSDWVQAVAVTPDGKLAISASDDHTLKVWDLESGEVIGAFGGDSSMPACAVAPDGVTVVACERSGSVHFLRLEGILSGPPWVTAWHRPKPSLWGRFLAQHPPMAVGCPCCRTWSAVQRSSLGHPLTCPHCGHALHLNPFVIEADWRPVAKAWKPNVGG
jgi:hypothetical protein